MKDSFLTPMENRLPVGPGSRGGTFHIPEERRRYYREWRRAHPEYMAREVERAAKAKAVARENRPPKPNIYDALRLLVVRDPQSLRSLSRQVMVDHSSISRFKRGERLPSHDLMLALTDYYGMPTVYAAWRSLHGTWLGRRATTSARPG